MLSRDSKSIIVRLTFSFVASPLDLKIKMYYITTG